MEEAAGLARTLARFVVFPIFPHFYPIYSKYFETRSGSYPPLVILHFCFYKNIVFFIFYKNVVLLKNTL